MKPGVLMTFQVQIQTEINAAFNSAKMNEGNSCAIVNGNELMK
ncbi:MAG TPA: hypothetical protein VJU78_03460 [Chitinophagaceae bacterium]|nr:hypothetical protein [Chitinophagaceae bacterium]